ncbi:helix-turn-helix transcriptional regulator [Streptomyces sp. SP17BM10]|uniref:helix-turn-helix domain-containing protein n=1 Tax=Streptomyces sp. SP17BM10 TaxID=3002530 RepID=UPI002E7A27E6|nr:helix-turn-helix transcriptional regulator [Streptomyces sp. SP17BM10]MEE1781756.1 helix-turn-helix transcriptional regulator [Streptomyces sp. SP17BM10]
MGRREKPVAASDPALGRLAAWLREQRERAGLTYRQLAARTNYHPTTLQRAAGGRTVPNWTVVEAFTRECGGDLRAARRKWAQANYWAHVPRPPGPQRRRAPRPLHPEQVDSFADLRRAMHEMRRKADWPALEELDRRARARGARLPSSTLALVLKGEAPLHKPVFRTYMEVCGVRETRRELWATAWDRAAIARTPVSVTPRTYQREFTRAMRNSSGGISTENLLKLWVTLRNSHAADRAEDTGDSPPVLV